MEKIKFKCTLLSDIILSQNSSTEGNQLSLDFIPGNNFLGIAAATIYDKVNALDVFHSGKVRFGDANPSLEGKVRGLKVPNAMFYPKLSSESEECYIYHLIPNLDSEEVKNLQLKQCRKGFYAFENELGIHVETKTKFAIKSKYNSEKRRSEDEKLYGYQSIQKGLTLFFEIESDLDAATNNIIVESIQGVKHVGRSRTAQYGLVNIEKEDYSEILSSDKTFEIGGKKYATVYADGRLIFLDENGEPSFRPSPKDLGFSDADKIDWSKSQIRTFQYSPWNGKRHTYDADRCGFEKGSVFVVECSASPSESTYVGSYNNEGFGKVVYNPCFMEVQDKSGKSKYTLKDIDPNAKPVSSKTSADTPLLKYLKKQKSRYEGELSVFERVNEFVIANKDIFKGQKFASQWSSIRNIAMITPENEIKKAIENFLSHGVAKEKWNKSGRNAKLKKFLNDIDSNVKENVINLASQMGKGCGKEVKKS